MCVGARSDVSASADAPMLSTAAVNGRNPESVVITFEPTTSDGSTTSDDATAAELPVDIQQLLDESERQALELLRTSSECIRTRLLGRQQPQSTSPAALKAILDEQTQWLKATLDRTSSLEALEAASEARSTARCCRLPWLGARTIIRDRHPLTRRFKLAPLEFAYRQSLHRPWKRKIRLVGLLYLPLTLTVTVTLTLTLTLALTRWRRRRSSTV